MLPALGLALAEAATPAPPPIVEGTASEGFGSTVLLYVHDGEEHVHGICSGTAIHPGWVLTAAHCVDLSVYDIEVGGVRAYVARSASDIEQQADAANWYAHPDYDPELYYADVALLELGTPFDVTPMAVADQPITTDDLHQDFRVVGFGSAYTGDTSTPRKRYADMELVRFDERLFVVDDVEGASAACYGDSGGPVLRPSGSGYELAGVSNFIFVSTSCEDSQTAAARVDAYLDWVHGYTDTYDREAIESGAWQDGTRYREARVPAGPSAELPAEPELPAAGCASAGRVARGGLAVAGALFLAISRRRAGAC